MCVRACIMLKKWFNKYERISWPCVALWAAGRYNENTNQWNGRQTLYPREWSSGGYSFQSVRTSARSSIAEIVSALYVPQYKPDAINMYTCYQPNKGLSRV